MENDLILKKNNEPILKEGLIKILAWFDIFNYPLTAYEVRQYLGGRADLATVMAALNSAGQLVNQKDGFYFLPGREEIITTRQKRYNYSNRKLKIARRFAHLFGLFPGVLAVCLANTIGAHNLRDASDIDFFIITKPGRLWLSRLYCAGLTKLMNRRPMGKNKRDKICLSFYITADHLNLAGLRLAAGDPYLDYWQRGLVLLYNKKGTYEKFLAANGLSGHGLTVEPKTRDDKAEVGAAKSFWEKYARQWQLKIMPAELKAAAAVGGGVILDDQVLKLYWPDKRAEFLNEFNHKLHALLQNRN